MKKKVKNDFMLGYFLILVWWVNWLFEGDECWCDNWFGCVIWDIVLYEFGKR